MTPDLEAAQAHVQTLEALLQEEFEALRTQSFDRLEALQSDKIAQLQALQAIATLISSLPEAPVAWSDVLAALTRCQVTYRRNELLITRQIEVVGATLRSLDLDFSVDSADLYDRMGLVARRGGRRVHSQA